MFLRGLLTVGILANALIGSLCVVPTTGATAPHVLPQYASTLSHVPSTAYHGDRRTDARPNGGAHETTCCDGHSLMPSSPDASIGYVNAHAPGCASALPIHAGAVESLAYEGRKVRAISASLPPPPTGTVVLLQ